MNITFDKALIKEIKKLKKEIAYHYGILSKEVSLRISTQDWVEFETPYDGTYSALDLKKHKKYRSLSLEHLLEIWMENEDVEWGTT